MITTVITMSFTSVIGLPPETAGSLIIVLQRVNSVLWREREQHQILQFLTPILCHLINYIRGALKYFRQADPAEVIPNQSKIRRRLGQPRQDFFQINRIMWQRVGPARDVHGQGRVTRFVKALPVSEDNLTNLVVVQRHNFRIERATKNPRLGVGRLCTSLSFFATPITLTRHGAGLFSRPLIQKI